MGALEVRNYNSCNSINILGVVVGAVRLKTLTLKIGNNKDPKLLFYNWNISLKINRSMNTESTQKQESGSNAE